MGFVSILTDISTTADEIRTIMYRYYPRIDGFHWIRTINTIYDPLEKAIVKQGLTYSRQINNAGGGKVLYLCEPSTARAITKKQVEYIQRSLEAENTVFSCQTVSSFQQQYILTDMGDLCKKYCACLSEICRYCGVNCPDHLASRR